MRRVGAILGALGGIAMIVAAFLPFVTKEGEDIPTVGGTISATLRGIDTWVGWVVLGAGALVLVTGLLLIFLRSRILAALMFLGGGVGAAAGIWILIDPTDFFVRISAAQVDMDVAGVSGLLEFVDQTVVAGAGPWIAAAGGGLAVLLGLALVVAPKRDLGSRPDAGSDAPTTPVSPSEADGPAQAAPEPKVEVEGREEAALPPMGDEPRDPGPAQPQAPDSDDWR